MVDTKAKPGRKPLPEENRTIGRMVSLTNAEWAEIDKRAEEKGVSRSEVIRRLVRIWMDGMKP